MRYLSLKKYLRGIGLCYWSCMVCAAQAQNTVRILVKDSASHEKLPGVTVVLKGTTIGAITDKEGRAFLKNIPAGEQHLICNYIGYQPKQFILDFPLGDTSERTVFLAPSSQSLEEVTVVSARSDSRIENLPIKVEVLGTEDLDEENGIKPGNIAGILGDFAGIQLQNTSPATGNLDLRIQGLNGKYTQILRDGLPLYEGYSGGLGILQVPPLDLKQIELVKGSASTLYGGGAIAGLINLISKRPGNRSELSVTLNRSSLKENNMNGYYAQKWKSVGITLYAGGNYQEAVDVNKDGFSDVPLVKSVLVHPRFFFDLAPKTSLVMGYSGTFEKRKGGDMLVLQGVTDSVHQYFTNIITSRNTFDWNLEHRIDPRQKLVFKGAESLLSREVAQYGFGFRGFQNSQFSELNYQFNVDRHSLVAGLNLYSDHFDPQEINNTVIHSFTSTTVGTFVQDTWVLDSVFTLQTGLRSDDHTRYGLFLLPQVSLLFKPAETISTRIGFGTGYRVPNLFQDGVSDETLRYASNIGAQLVPERSVGFNADVNYKFYNKQSLSVTINQAVLYTRISQPILSAFNGQTLNFYNSTAPLTSFASETYVRMTWAGLQTYLGYNLTLTTQNGEQIALTPRHKFATVMTYEIEDEWRMGLETAYTASQYLSDRSTTPGYWILNAMIARRFSFGSLVLNTENLLDYRQAKRTPLWSGSYKNPVFQEIWAPIDGRVVNLSLRIKIK